MDKQRNRKYEVSDRKYRMDDRKYEMSDRQYGTDDRKYGMDDRKYGINVRKWCAQHEAYVEEVLSKAGTNEKFDRQKEPDRQKELDRLKELDRQMELERLKALHEKKLSWLMHERLVHLIVLFITVILALFAMGLLLFLPETLPASLPLFMIVFVLLIFYVRHYFFLENTVQRWYMIDERIRAE